MALTKSTQFVFSTDTIPSLLNESFNKPTRTKVPSHFASLSVLTPQITTLVCQAYGKIPSPLYNFPILYFVFFVLQWSL